MKEEDRLQRGWFNCSCIACASHAQIYYITTDDSALQMDRQHCTQMCFSRNLACVRRSQITYCNYYLLLFEAKRKSNSKFISSLYLRSRFISANYSFAYIWFFHWALFSLPGHSFRVYFSSTYSFAYFFLQMQTKHS